MSGKTKAPQGYSKVYYELVRSIGECKSKQEEDKIIVKETANLKGLIGQPNTTPKLMREYLLRMIYCEMLGHVSDFGYIHAVKLMPSANLTEKRVGYMAVSLCLKPEDELMMLVVAQIQKDLKSTNYLEVCIGLTACCKMLNAELIPCVIGDVKGLLEHQNALVRKKAGMACHSFYRAEPASIGEDLSPYRNLLCDKDPSVMGASLHLVYEFALANPEAQKDLVPSIVGILKQITEHRLSREYDYHRIPAPWLQIKLLRLLAVLCADDPENSELAYDVVLEAIKRSDSGINIGHAVIHECVKTITTIHPKANLIEAAADSISKFVTSTNPNLKYLGITALSSIVRIDAKYAMQHQMVVMDCLEDPDETLRRKTVDLLCAMTNEMNVEVIAEKLTKFLSRATDNYMKADLAKRICDLSWKLRVTNEWYVDTIVNLMVIDPKHVPEATVQGMLQMIAEGDEEREDDDEDEDPDSAFRTHCAEKFFKLLTEDERSFPDEVYKVIAWVLGEYGFLLHETVNPKEMIDCMCDLLDRPYEEQDTQGYVLMALMKLTSPYANELKQAMVETISKFKQSHSTDLQQRGHEFKVLLGYADMFKEVLPLDGCCAEEDIDSDLSFMDTWVDDCITRGYKRYEKPPEFQGIEEEVNSGLNIDEYEAPDTMRHAADIEQLNDSVLDTAADNEPTLIGSKANIWKNSDDEQEKEEEEQPTLDAPVDGPFGADAGAGTKGKKKKKGKKKAKAMTSKQKEAHLLFGGTELLEQEMSKAAGKQAKKPRTATSSTPTFSVALPEGAVTSKNDAGSAGPYYSVQYQKIFGATEICYAFYIKSDTVVMSELTCSLEFPGGLEVYVTTSEQPMGSTNVAFQQDVPVGTEVMILAHVKVNDATFGSTLRLTAEATVNGAKGGSLMFDIPLLMVDFVRAVGGVEMADFGNLWLNLTGEAKEALTVGPGVTTATVAAKLTQMANAHQMALTDTELVMVTNVINLDLNIFIHAMMAGNTLSYTIRSAKQSLAQGMTDYLKTYIPLGSV